MGVHPSPESSTNDMRVCAAPRRSHMRAVTAIRAHTTSYAVRSGQIDVGVYACRMSREARNQLAFESLISTLRPTARAYLRKDVSDGVRPLSIRATADCEVPMRRATCAWVSFALARAAMSSFEMENSSS